MDYKEKLIALMNDNEMSQGLKEKIMQAFPELKESDDERIRKEIIELVWQPTWRTEKEYFRRKELVAWLEKQGGEQNLTPPIWKYKKDDTPLSIDSLILNKYGCVSKSPSGALVSDVWVIDFEELAKLPKEEVEKQGEQKPTDKMELKLHEGEWLCENEPNNYARFIQILERVNVQGKDRYRNSRDIHKDEDVVEFGFVEKYYHKFDIKDAKDGDVLHSPSHRLIWIYKDNEHYHSCVNMNYVTGNVATDGLISIPNDACPATKDEQTILFARMKEAGYEWDDKIKELKKIEQKQPTELSEEDKNTLDFLVDYLLDTIKKMPAEEYAGGLGEAVVLLKSLKDRVQPKQEWGKEDVCNLQDIDSVLFYDKSLPEDTRMRLRNWLKSLRPQNRWKPSDEQIEAIRVARSFVTDDFGENPTLSEILIELEKQLKKLKEEQI